MKFGLQHNGYGKIHLTNTDDTNICGCPHKGMPFDMPYSLKYQAGKFFEFNEKGAIEVLDAKNAGYCKRCIKVVLQTPTTNQ